MRLVFINRFYWPETPATGQLLTDLAEALAERGDGVDVITSAAPGGAPRAETRHGVRIHRVRGTRWHRAGVIGKAFDFATFYLGGLGQLLRLVARDGIVVSMTDPPLLGIGAWVIARMRGARIVHWVQDIYPEIAMELSGQRSLRVLRPLRDLAWRRADGCVTLGADMASVLRVAGVPAENIFVIPNWALGELTALEGKTGQALRREWRLEGKFVVGYSGNLGRVHDLEPVLAVAEALRDDSRFAFVFIGEGAQRRSLEAAAAGRALTQVAFQPAQPRARLAESLAVADVHLVTLRPGCERLVFPSKLYGAAAIGRPILFIGPHDCEVARLVRQHDLGFAAEREETSAIAAFIRDVADNRATRERHAEAARRFAARHARERAAEQWMTTLEQTGACPARAAHVSTRTQ